MSRLRAVARWAAHDWSSADTIATSAASGKAGNEETRHRRVPILRRDFEDTAGQGTSDTSAGYGRRHHETCIGNMAAGSWLIRMKLGGSHKCTIINGDEHPAAGLAHPPRSCRVFTGVGRPAVGVAGGDDLLQEPPDVGPIRIDDIADLHFAS